MKTIRVTGKGNLKVHPDMTRITITLNGMDLLYNETLRKSSEATEKLKDLLVPFGFERSDLKTLSFDVRTEYERYEEKVRGRTEYKTRFAGYTYSHRMKIEFDSDNDRLGKILYSLANRSLNPEFRLSYTVKDPEAAKNELLDKAVQDAVAKAGVLTRAASQKLGEIQSIDYSWGRIDFEFSPMDRELMPEVDGACLKECASLPLDIEPDDIEVGDTVTVVWEIL